MSVNTTPASWVSGETPSGAKMQTEVHDLSVGLQAQWVDYVPALTSSGTNPTLGNSTITGSYHRVGKTIHVKIMLTIGSSFVAGTGTYVLGLPAASAETIPMAVGSSSLYDASTGTRSGGIAVHFGPSSVFIQGFSGVVTAAAPWTWAVGDFITVAGTYEAA